MASAARRGTVVGGALVATVAAHVLSGAPLATLPVAPLLWLAIVGVAVLPGLPARAAGAFRVWSTARIVTVLVIAQAAFHAMLVEAPWVVGMVGHHHPEGLLGVRAAVVHLAAALLLTAVIRRGQKWVTRLADIGRALLGLMPPRRRSRPPVVVSIAAAASPRPAPSGPRTSRGPPHGGLPALA